MQFIKKNIVVLLAFSLPVILIIGIAASAYLPGLFIKTQYDFVYATCVDGNGYYPYDCRNYLNNLYRVEGGKVTTQQIDTLQDTDKDGVPDVKENYTVRFFLHDTEKNEGREITFAEVGALNLRDLLTSPDGVSVSSGYDRNNGDFFFIFGGSSQYGYYLTKGSKQRRLNLVNENERYYYENNFKFMGWVI